MRRRRRHCSPFTTAGLLAGLALWSYVCASVEGRAAGLPELGREAEVVQELKSRKDGQTGGPRDSASNPPEPERVELHGVLYEVSPPWREKRIELSVDPSTLVPLPARFTREHKIYVTAGTRDAFAAMATAALEAGVHLEVNSGFRSYRYQKQLVEKRLAKGMSFNDAVRWIAPPGYSEHITGRAVDFVPTNRSFSRTAAYEWLRGNADAFCFSESYPETGAGGFLWEPWHWRYEECGPRR